MIYNTIVLVSLSLPLVDPVVVFAIVLFVIFFAPLIFNKLKIPGIIGLIIAGALLGPNGFYVLENDSAIQLFGKVGLLYIMFLAGLEIDLKDFKKNMGKSLLFGSLTFLLPMAIGTALAFYFLYELLGISITGAEMEDYIFMASLLMASMFASHTLLAYPIVSKYGLLKTEASTITVGGTIITDTAALLVLAVIISATNGVLDNEFWIRLGISLFIFCIIVFVIFPWVTRWFFRSVESEGVHRYIFTLGIVFTAAVLAELAGIEAIIGAFCAGLALNRLIPHASALMNRIEFVGNALFIPFFLISVGMLVNYRVLFEGPETLIVAAVMVFAANSGKFSAAWVTQKLLGYNKYERGLIFGLSNAQAAATLAVVLIAFQIGLFNENVLNGTIIMILVTCLISSLVTERNSKKLAIIEAEKDVELPEETERIMVPIANPENMDKLIDFAILIKNQKVKEPIYALSIVKDDTESAGQLVKTKKLLEEAMQHAAASETEVSITSRVDLNIGGGIVRAAKELFISDIIVGWNGKMSTRDYVFGSILDQVLAKTDQTIMVSKIIHPVSTIRKILLAVPPGAHLEFGFNNWIEKVKRLAKETGSNIQVIAPNSMIELLEKKLTKQKPRVDTKFQEFENWDDFLVLSRDIKEEDLFIVVKARPGGPSYDRSFDKIPTYLSTYFTGVSFIVIYPERRHASYTLQQTLTKLPVNA